MKRFRRIVLAVCLVNFAVSTVLLLNITAPNPTHRRYSTQTPLTTGQDSSNAIGDSGERVLSQDLGVPRNDLPDQRQCFCNNPIYNMPSDCRVCIAYYQGLTAQFRRPDFMTSGFVGESKNVLSLRYRDNDILNQIGDYALASRTLHRPLWVYTRVDTNVDPEYYDMIARTGGGVVRYFTVPGWNDSVDMGARNILLGSLALFVLFGVWELGSRRQWGYQGGSRQPAADPTPRAPKPSSKSDPVVDAIDSFDRAEDFIKINRNKLD